MASKFYEAMMFRHATKEFDGSKKINEEDFRSILDFGRLSPSSFGYEPWRFLIIQNEFLRKKLKEFTWGAQGTLLNASHFIVILARKKSMKFGSEYLKHIEKDIHLLNDETYEAKGRFYEKFQKRDFEILANDRTLFDWSSKQTYIALANMMSGASYMGIDSCPIEGFDMKKANDFIKEELDINTDEFGVSVMLALGYRKNQPVREKTRQNLEDITKWYR